MRVDLRIKIKGYLKDMSVSKSLEDRRKNRDKLIRFIKSAY